MSKISLNTSPYFDDFDSNKNFFKILYKPGFPVQTRELNQTQSIFKNQIEKFADHIFKNGSRVSNGRTDFKKCKFVIVNLVTPESFLKENNTISSSSGVIGQIIFHEQLSSTQTKIWYTKLSSGTTGTAEFVQKELLTITDLATTNTKSINVIDSSSYSGIDTIFVIDEGTFYHSGTFIFNQRQFLVLNKLSGLNTNFKIGLNLVESVIDYTQDSSLLDNSLGYSNIGSPGADRYKIDLIVSAKPEDNLDDSNFIHLANFSSDGSYFTINADSEYSDIMDMLAQRTFEESGNYIVKPFDINLYEDKDDNNFVTNRFGDSTKFVAQLTNGLAYVKGYRVAPQGQIRVKLSKARDTITTNNISLNIANRAEIKLTPTITKKLIPFDETTGTFVLDYTSVNIYDGVLSAGIPTGSIIGSCVLYDPVYVSGTIGTNAVYSYKISKISFNSGKTILNAKSFYSATVDFSASTISATPEILNFSNSSLVYDLGIDYLRSLKSSYDSSLTDVSIQYNKVLKGTLDGSGIISFTAEQNESFISQSSVTVACYLKSGSTYTHTNLTSKITVSSNSKTVTFNLTATHAGKTIVVMYPTRKAFFKERQKTFASNTVTFTLSSQNVIDVKSAAGLTLPHTDIIRIRNVRYYTTDISKASSAYLVFSKLINNDTDFEYKLNSISIPTDNAGIAISGKLEVTYDYFIHEDISGYFSVNSYDSAITNNNISYDDIQIIKSGSKYLNLKNCLDFRTYNSKKNISPNQSSTILTTITKYVPRIDTIALTKQGQVIFKSGVPAEIPKIPELTDDYLRLFDLTIPAYTTDLSEIDISYNDARVYTMANIGTLENRIKNLEYYTSLNQLELSTVNLSTKNDAGLERFKNGFVVENFNSTKTADISNQEFKSTISVLKEMHPKFDFETVSLAVDSYTGMKVVGDLAYLDFTEEIVDFQSYATNSVTIAAFSNYKKEGQLIVGCFDIENLNSFHRQTQSRNANILEPIREFPIPVNSSTDIESIYLRWLPKPAYNQPTQYNFRPGVDTYYTYGTKAWFMQPTRFYIWGSGLIPNNRYYLFIDGVDMSHLGLTNFRGFGMYQDQKGLLYTGLGGRICITIDLPANTLFEIGIHNVRLSDSPFNSIESEESYAYATFIKDHLGALTSQWVPVKKDLLINSTIVNSTNVEIDLNKSKNISTTPTISTDYSTNINDNVLVTPTKIYDSFNITSEFNIKDVLLNKSRLASTFKTTLYNGKDIPNIIEACRFLKLNKVTYQDARSIFLLANTDLDTYLQNISILSGVTINRSLLLTNIDLVYSSDNY